MKLLQHLECVLLVFVVLSKDGAFADPVGKQASKFTNLMYDGLRNELVQKLPVLIRNRFDIITRTKDYFKEGEKKEKKRIYWLLEDEDPDTLFEVLKNDGKRGNVVFISEYQRARYLKRLDNTNNKFMNVGLALKKSVVMKPAVGSTIMENPVKPKSSSPIRLIFVDVGYYSNNEKKSRTNNFKTEKELIFSAFESLFNKKDIVLDIYSNDVHNLLICEVHDGCSQKNLDEFTSIRDVVKSSDILLFPHTEDQVTAVGIAIVIEALACGLEVIHSGEGILKDSIHFGMGLTYNKDSKDAFTEVLENAVSTYWEDYSMLRRRKYQIAAMKFYNWGEYGYTVDFNPEISGRINEWMFMLAKEIKEILGVDDNLSMDATPSLPERNKFSSNEYVDAMFAAGQLSMWKGNPSAAMYYFQMAMKETPQNVPLFMAFANLAFAAGRYGMEELSRDGFEKLEFLLKSGSIADNSETYYNLAGSMAMRKLENFDYEDSKYWYDKAYESKYMHDDCNDMVRATLLPHVPMSENEAMDNIARANSHIDELLQKGKMLYCGNSHHMYPPFALAYYDLNFLVFLEKWVSLFRTAFPQVLYSPPKLIFHQNKTSFVNKTKIKVGVISSNLNPTTSVWASFGATVQALQLHPNIELDFIYNIQGRKPEKMEEMLSDHPETNIYLKSMHGGNLDNLMANHKMIEERQYDILFYLELWLSIEMHSLAVAKLAPLQIVSFGHPTTSGLPAEVMDYFFSWGQAELENRTEAQEFYSEELYLIDGCEYYERRTNDAGVSNTLGLSFAHVTKTTLDFYPSKRDEKLMKNSKYNWYFSSQNLFKFHNSYDRALAQIQKKDPNALLILVELTFEHNYNRLGPRIKKRLKSNGVDFDRVVFLPRMKHDYLMTMYNISDVVLDSFVFGGCTTSREAMEVGSIIVTLPHKTPGQRFTQGYYKMIGITDYIAKNPEEYVQIAVDIGTMKNRTLYNEKRSQIRNAARGKLFNCKQAFTTWANAFFDIVNRPRRWSWDDEVEESSKQTIEVNGESPPTQHIEL